MTFSAEESLDLLRRHTCLAQVPGPRQAQCDQVDASGDVSSFGVGPENLTHLEQLDTLGAIASGLGENLIHRAAAVCLKERRPLMLLHRESPLSLIEIQNMERVTLAGATVVPASPGFYMLPKTLEDVVDFVVGRLLDLVKVEHSLHTRWTESEANWKSRAGETKV